MEEITFEELKDKSKELVALLRKKGHPHMTIIITCRDIKVTEDKMGMPLDYDD